MKKNLNQDIVRVIEEIEVAVTSNKLQGYFMLLDFGDSKTLIRYDSEHYPQLLGLVTLMKADLEKAMLESLQAFRSQPDGVLKTDEASRADLPRFVPDRKAKKKLH